ncbi:gephyrin-like molybdotransferase Glp [Microbulbifer hydrolyticus]|uniref:Molybdopterin molybdenumtransferase n=1 Tax=Microbulbifer hydrolyticus TaxID=48074 RepID=A0A6P1TDZ4_9GAMM|nr:gephyrin-like molybdotransferase Glp [Microbulbifer hydrolyticus]MBB5212417.1 molybdopterin molybdotransferase [Microbulbifer hydrolyticus]QHQ40051.1 molybdopterin molybdenumtransferase MoeA [Microbulbifer hydrolyticus]
MTDACAENGLRSVETAKQELIDSIAPIKGSESIPLAEACSRVLAAPVLATLDLPPCDNSAMDGYALSGEHESYTVIGKSLAGHPFSGALEPGQAIRITTGAAVPAGADRVQMQENCTLDSDQLTMSRPAKPGENIRRRGEDVHIGQSLIAVGSKIKVPHIALLAAAGVAKVTVTRKIKAALLSIGDELKPIGTPAAELGDGDIYDSNRIALNAALEQLDVEVLDLGCWPDQPDKIREAFVLARDNADFVITSGGVSVGEADYTKTVLQELGEIGFWKLAIKPGKPFAFGRLPRADGETVFFGLPGNPVSAIVTLYQLVVPALEKLRGTAEEYRQPPLQVRARLLNPIRKKPGRTDYQRGFTYRDEDGLQVVGTRGIQGSHILSGFAQANCFVVLPREGGDCETGDWVTVEPFLAPLK